VVAPLEARAQEPSALDEEDRQRQADAFVLPEGAVAAPPLAIMGYIDVGFARARGDGTSFAPGDPREEPDYHTDPFAPAVSSRGDVASTDSGGKPLSGFLPRTVNSGGRGAFLLNTLDLDLRYQAPGAGDGLCPGAVLAPLGRRRARQPDHRPYTETRRDASADSTVAITPTVAFPFTSAATATGAYTTTTTATIATTGFAAAFHRLPTFSAFVLPSMSWL
jgi:hypothetical protein